MDAVTHVEPSTTAKKETIRKQKHERAKSDVDKEILKQENIHKLRIIEDSSAQSRASTNSDNGSVVDSESHKRRSYRTLSLNVEQVTEVLPDFKPFFHKELYPQSIQKYLAASQRNRKFNIAEAICKLKIPNHKSHAKNLDKMRLLGLVQEREVDSQVNYRATHSLTDSPADSPRQNLTFGDFGNPEEVTVPKPSQFRRRASDVPLQYKNVNQSTSPYQQSMYQQQSFSPNSLPNFNNLQMNHFSPQQMPNQGYNQNQSPGINPSMQGLQQNMMPPQFPQYPSQNSNSTVPYSQIYFQPPIQPDPFNFSNDTHNHMQSPQQNYIQAPRNPSPALQNYVQLQPFTVDPQPSPNGVSPTKVSEKELVDQQLVKINNLLVQRPRRMYKLNTVDPSTMSRVTGLFRDSPGILSPMSPRSDTQTFNCPLQSTTSSLTEKRTDYTVNDNKTNSQNSFKTEDSKAAGVGVDNGTLSNLSSLLASPKKKNPKIFHRMNTDPSQMNNLLKTIGTGTASPHSNSPHHSQSPSYTSLQQMFPPPLSHFSTMGTSNPSINMIPSNQSLGMTYPPSIPTVFPSRIQSVPRGPTQVYESLAQNLPGSPKKKVRSFYRMNTDPTHINQFAESNMDVPPSSFFKPNSRTQ